MYIELENRFNIIYPENENATYSSLLNFSDDLEKPRQRWFRYKEGFSVELVANLIKTYNKNKHGKILDPFLGSGSTIVAANKMGLCGIGFEVNPFSYFLSICKLKNYVKSTVDEFGNRFKTILEDSFEIKKYELPKLSISDKVFDKAVEQYFMNVKLNIDNSVYLNKDTKDLLLLGWLSSIEYLSNYRKAGNGLKKKKYVKPRVVSVQDVFNELTSQYTYIFNDLRNNEDVYNAQIINDTCLNMSKHIDNSTISGIIFSPPYANCFDYTEIYKLELWFGGFVKEYSDLKILRKQSLHSHLNGELIINENIISTKNLETLLDKVKTKKLWDKKIPQMLALYYHDMFNVINQCYAALEQGGFCCIVVGNSAYGGVIFPADLLMAEYAESVGFIVDKIEVDRYIITSSQQYEITKDKKQYLRESVVCLIKK